MSPEQWLWLLLECTVKGSVILGVAWLVTRALRRKSAALRHIIWTAAALCALALPVLTVALPAWQSDMFEKATSLWVRGAQKPIAESSSLLPAMAVRAGAETRSRTRIVESLLVIWTVGFGIGILALLLGGARLAWLVSRAEPLFIPRWMRLMAELSRAAGLNRPVRLLQSRWASMPVTWGVLHPRVLLPKDAEKWPAERMRIVLAHELAHIKRHDWLVQILAEIGRAVYWFSPLVWVGCNRLREESEQACDDAVLNSGIDAPDYAGHLLELARTLKSSERAWSVALAMARQSNLERRFLAMFNPSISRRTVTRKAACLTTLAALCLMLPLAALRAPAQNPSGRLSGFVYDATGGVIQNATVIVSNLKANTKDMTTTNAIGWFEFTGLPAGDYVLEVLKPGFARYQMPKVTLESNRNLQQDVTLQIGSVSERIDVVGESPAKAAEAIRTPERVRVGGNVQQTSLVHMVKPPYPPVARAAGIEGSVLLEAVIATDGRLMSLKVMNSQIDPELARAAVEAVSQWRYQPTLLNGVPVEVITNITVNFTLSQ